MKCAICNGGLEEGKTVLTFKVQSEKLIVVQNVPALICNQCGEEIIELKYSLMVEKQVQKAISNGISMGFIEFIPAA
ncbi:MAG: YgiT-type zinc finger protein [Melioribacteraceae bacterium]|nr:YgiT-type zinc finger protein [Melioribacteraceae bacterium]